MRLLTFALLLVSPAALRAQEGYDRTEAMVPMRDGTKLFTTLHVPKNAKEPPAIIFVRTPYGIDGLGERSIYGNYKDLAADGYAFAFQDCRGRYKSEGTFVMLRPARDPKDPKAIDEASDTQDTIDWLLKQVPNNNGRVGMLGISYPGWLTAVAMLDPHPALKAASPQASPSDMFLGDDFHHNGAFRLSYGFEYAALMETNKTNFSFEFDKYDAYEWYLNVGPLSNINRKYLKGSLPTWNDFTKHPNYDAFWKKQSLEPRLTRVTVPTLNVAGWYDQEDFRGPLKIYELLEKHDKENKNFLVVGPWNHGGWGGNGSRLGRVSFGSDTAAFYREKVQAPFFAKYLKDKGEVPPEARVFQTGSNKWVTHDQWPPKAAAPKKLFFRAGGKLAFDPPKDADAADEYVSDPANPVPYYPRPIRPVYASGSIWSVWMLQDQRFTHHRPDVVSYMTDPLEEDVTLSGAIVAKLFASTSGTDSDWVVRLIDVYPEEGARPADMAGFQLMIAGEPLRGRFRNGYEKPLPVKPGAVEEYNVDLVWGHHRFRKGHRIMVQVSSSWFPVIDRNPQTFVPNIFEAEEKHFVKATQRIHRSLTAASHITLDVLKE